MLGSSGRVVPCLGVNEKRMRYRAKKVFLTSEDMFELTLWLENLIDGLRHTKRQERPRYCSFQYVGTWLTPS